MNHQLSLRAGISALAALALATGVAACGSSGGNDTATTAAQQTATQTVTQTNASGGQAGSTTTSTAETVQKEAPVSGGKKSLTSGPLTLSVNVKKVADPLKTIIDTAQQGNKLVGIFLRGKTSGKFEPVKTTATAVLKTDQGNATVVRVISDGNCSGGFFPGGLFDESTDQSGCVGFEIPKSATPQAITIAIQYEGAKPAQGTWSLPKTQ